jgi:cytochrome c oxidase subunit 2
LLWVLGAARRWALVVAVFLVSGCGSDAQSALDPHSDQSRKIDHLWWGMLAAAGVVFAGTLALLALSWLRRRREGLPFVGERESVAKGLVVAFGIVIPVAALTTLFFISDIGLVKAIDKPKPQMTVDVVGHQWFWEVRYPGSAAVTANEIHIPVGKTVLVRLASDDVIHSFWVPELGKKVDMVPGHPNTLKLSANRVGTYRGQCAEFCGLQHAHMAMTVDAQAPAAFKTWLADMAEPVDRSAPDFAAGLAEFTNDQCASCHTLRGTPAHGRIGPDLTHLMTRRTLAALTLRNTPAELAAWIRDPQHSKPGARMPNLHLTPGQVDRLTAFLRGLR